LIILILFSVLQLKTDYMRLLQETPSIHAQSRYPESRAEIEDDPRFEAVGDEGLRRKWFDEYVEGLVGLIYATPLHYLV